MHVVTVQFRIKSEHQEGFMKLMQQNASESLQTEAGCKQFDVCSDSGRPGEIFLYEVYVDATAFDLHLQSAHFRRFDDQTRQMIETKNVTVFDQLYT